MFYYNRLIVSGSMAVNCRQPDFDLQVESFLQILITLFPTKIEPSKSVFLCREQSHYTAKNTEELRTSPYLSVEI